MENKITASQILKEYENGLEYQKNMGYYEKFPMYERFKFGEQWPPATDRTRYMPRPVMNIIKYIVNQRKSNLLNSPLNILFSADETIEDIPEEMEETEENSLIKFASEGADKYTNLAKYVWEDLKQDELNDKITEDACTNGTGFVHYFWDINVKGGITNSYIGAIRGEIIDGLNIFVSNPQDEEIQNQDYIIVSKRVNVDKVKEIAKKEGISFEDIENISSDTTDENYDTSRSEDEEQNMTTLLTRYYRKKVNVTEEKDGVIIKTEKNQVFFVKSVGETLITKEHNTRLEKYPIAKFDWYRRKKSFFGVGEVEGIIPNQKAINFNIAMQLLAVQDMGFPKIIIPEGSIDQKITNEPGEIIVEHTFNGAGVRYLNPPAFSSMPLNLSDSIYEKTRTLAGVSDTSTGEAFTANMAASAIIALQNQAKVPIQNIQQKFFRFIEDVARIWLEFFRHYYSTGRTFAVEDEMGQKHNETVRGTDYKDFDYKLKIDVGTSSAYSESLAQSSLDKLFDRGDIDVETYVDLSPNTVMPFKERLKEIFKQQREIQQQMPEQQQAVPQEEMQSQISQEGYADTMANPEISQAVYNKIENESI